MHKNFSFFIRIDQCCVFFLFNPSNTFQISKLTDIHPLRSYLLEVGHEEWPRSGAGRMHWKHIFVQPLVRHQLELLPLDRYFLHLYTTVQLPTNISKKFNSSLERKFDFVRLSIYNRAILFGMQDLPGRVVGFPFLDDTRYKRLSVFKRLGIERTILHVQINGFRAEFFQRSG